MFSMFDTLLLLSKGSTVYFGPAGEAVTYFAMPPLRLVCPTLFNPADCECKGVLVLPAVFPGPASCVVTRKHWH